MAKQKNSKYYIALVQNVGLVALNNMEEDANTIVADIYSFSRNNNNTGWVFTFLPLFVRPTIMKHNVILLEEMPTEMATAFEAFLQTRN